MAASGLDSVTQYELWKALWSSLNDGNFFELAWALERHNGFLASFAPLTFAGNHDVTRLPASWTGPSTWRSRWRVLFTVGGTPSVYYGDEQAFRGVKEERAGGDDVIRPAFPGSPAELAPSGWDTYRLHQRLIGLRDGNRWLHRARTSVLHLANRQLAYRVSDDGSDGDRQLIVALNGDGAAPARLPVPGASAVAAGAGELAGPAGPDAVIELAAYGWAVLTAASSRLAAG